MIGVGNPYFQLIFFRENKEESGKSVDVRCKSFLRDRRLSEKLGARQKSNGVKTQRHDFGDPSPPQTYSHRSTWPRCYSAKQACRGAQTTLNCDAFQYLISNPDLSTPGTLSGAFAYFFASETLTLFKKFI